MSETDRLLSLLESARTEFGAAAVARLEGPIRAVAGLAPPAATGDPLRYPEGLFIPGLSAAPWHPRDFVPDAAMLEAAAPAMKAELDALLAGRGTFQPFDEGEAGFRPDNVTGKWNVYYLYLGGEFVSPAEACPRTTAALRGLPNLAVSAMFSALTPGTHLDAHCGPTNAVVSLSMGLVAPPGCSMRVRTEERTWRAGECYVFDDTYEHEVWHRGDHTRFIMLLDVWHPDLTAAERKLIRHALWPPGEAEHQVQKNRTALEGQTWW